MSVLAVKRLTGKHTTLQEACVRITHILILRLHTLPQHRTVGYKLIVRAISEILLLRADFTEDRSDRYLRDVIRSRHVLLQVVVTLDDRGRGRHVALAVQLNLQSR